MWFTCLVLQNCSLLHLHLYKVSPGETAPNNAERESGANWVSDDSGSIDHQYLTSIYLDLVYHNVQSAADEGIIARNPTTVAGTEIVSKCCMIRAGQVSGWIFTKPRFLCYVGFVVNEQVISYCESTTMS